jgi:selenocysteine lyase/cysteine desulfurase
MTNRRYFLKNAAALSSMAIPQFGFASDSDRLEKIRATFSNASQLSNEAAAKDESLWTEVQKSYNYNPEIINLSSVVRGVSPQMVTDAVTDTYTRINEFRVGGNYVRGKKEEMRKRLAEFVGCTSEELAMTRNTTDGVTTVAFGMKLTPGDEIILSNQEHEHFYGAFYQRANQSGLTIKRVELPVPAATQDELVAVFERAVTSKTRLIFLCHVYLSGQIMPVRRICDFAHKRGIKVLVDGALAFGHIPVNVKSLDCDYYAGSLHKWAGGPRGTGFFYVKPGHIKELDPLYGYYDVKVQQAIVDGDKIQKFESTGTHPESQYNSIGQMLDFLEAMGMERIQARLHYLKTYWADQMSDEKELIFYASPDPSLSCSLFSFDFRNKKHSDVSTFLYLNDKILLGGAYLGGALGKPETWRDVTLCNTALFTTLEHLDRFTTALKRELRKN